MPVTRIVLSVEQKLHADLLKKLFSCTPEVELVGEAHDFVDILKLIHSKQPHLWIHSLTRGSAVEGILSHLESSHPNLISISVAPDESSGSLQLRIHSFANLLDIAKHSPALLACA